MWHDAWLERNRGDDAAWQYSDVEDDCEAGQSRLWKTRMTREKIRT